MKVSDLRSAKVQGKILAKKGVWVSEYRIESGLNCGGHAFATDGILLGPILDDWRTHGAMKRQTKRWAGLVMVLSFGASIWMVPAHWHRGVLLVIAAILGYFIWRVPVRDELGEPSRPGGCYDPPVMPDQVDASTFGPDQTPR